MKITKILSTVLFFSYGLSQPSFAHESGSFAAQIVHIMLNAHHAFGGLLIIAFLLLGFKLRKKIVAKRIRQKR